LIKITNSFEEQYIYLPSATMPTKESKPSKSKAEDASNACIIRFDIPNLNENRVEVKFGEGDESVKEYINIYREGDDKYNLLVLMFQILDLGDSYECWEEAAKAKNLANMMKRALGHGKAKKKWIDITSKRTAWGEANMREKFTKMLQKLGEETFGTRAYKKQVEAMEDGKLKLPEDQPLRDSIDRLFAINREIPYLSTKGEKLSLRALNKIIVKTLPLRAKVEFIKHGGEDLTTEEEILEIINDVDVCLELDDQVRRARKAERSHNHDKKRYEPKGKEESSTLTTTPGNNKESSACKLHDGAHLWKDCPDNKWNKNLKEQMKAEAADKKKESGDIHAVASTAKKTPICRIGKPEDLADDSSSDKEGGY
jgi:hypothetical protein